MTRDGILTTVANFDGANGERPVGPLALGHDGLYGSCYRGGIPGDWHGTVFRLDRSGRLTRIVSFTGYGGEYPGRCPYAGLARGNDSNLYGTTAYGGSYGAGNIFRIVMPGNECSVTSPTNITVCNDPGQCGAVVNFGPPITTNCAGYVVTANPPSGSFFPVGITTVTCTALDSASGQITNRCSFLVRVRDCEPPVIHSISASPALLWPPNHKMQPVTLSVGATDSCHLARSKIISVTSNEGPDNANRNGPLDWEIREDLVLKLRAERSGNGAGRVYTVTVECADDSGNTSTASVHVAVSH